MTFFPGILLSLALFALVFPFIRAWYETGAYWRGWSDGWKGGWKDGWLRHMLASYIGKLPCSINNCDRNAIQLFNHAPGGLMAYCSEHRISKAHGEIMLTRKENVDGNPPTQTPTMS